MVKQAWNSWNFTNFVPKLWQIYVSFGSIILKNQPDLKTCIFLTMCAKCRETKSNI